MEIEDIVIEDLFNFFMSFNDRKPNSDLKNVNSIIPYLAFLVAGNERAYSYVQNQMLNWEYKLYSNGFDKSPWINCKFVTRMVDLEKEKRIIKCLLYLNSETTKDNDIYQMLSTGWKRIALFVENEDIIDLKNAPLRKKVEDKWALCLLAYIKNRNIIQASNKKEWYAFSSELFFYYEYIVQLMDTDSLQDTALIRKTFLCNDELFLDIHENQDFENKDKTLYQIAMLIREKERMLHENLLVQEMKKVNSNICEVKEEKQAEYVSVNTESIHDLEGVLKQLERYERIKLELEKEVKILSDENAQLRKKNDILNEEIILWSTDDDDGSFNESELDWEYLARKKIVICGGRLEWLNKMKQMFPQWKYIENDNVRFDGHVLKDASIDVVVFNKRFVSHGLFYRVASQKITNVPLLCINSSNIDASLRIICNKLKNLELQ